MYFEKRLGILKHTFFNYVFTYDHEHLLDTSSCAVICQMQSRSTLHRPLLGIGLAKWQFPITVEYKNKTNQNACRLPQKTYYRFDVRYKS